LLSDLNKYSVNVGSELFKLANQRIKTYGNHNRKLIQDLGPVFWNSIKDKKTWRKTVKRPVMTLGYGGTRHGMVDMVNDDTRDLSEALRDKHFLWSVYLGHLIHRTCFEELHGPANMLRMFEALAKQENDKDLPVKFNQIVTNFPFVHTYREPETVRVDLYDGDQRLRINIQVWKKATLKKSKQETGAAPNIVHSVDAVHLTMYVHDTDYPVTVVHDSFGCHAGNMKYAFHDVRQKFVELYEMNPLEHIMSQMDAIHLIPKKGSLDISDIMESDFAFA